MVEYKCPRCGYESFRKGDFRRHLKRKNGCPPTISSILLSNNINTGLLRESEQIKLVKQPQIQQSQIESSMIYIGHNPKVPNIFKIGKTKDFLNRLGQHKGSNPDFSYKYTFQSPRAQKIETLVKHILKDHRYNGKTEWFSIDYGKMKQIVDNVVDICDNCL
jgi:hypothetical protein